MGNGEALPARGASGAQGAVSPLPPPSIETMSLEHTRDLLKAKLLRESQAVAYASLFPNAKNPFQ